jgi:hypothetical protein
MNEEKWPSIAALGKNLDEQAIYALRLALPYE